MRRLNKFPTSLRTQYARAAMDVLRKYGSNAHLYLPGVGAINGITAGNYLDSAGTTAASVDQPIGLMLDAENSVPGPNVSTGPSWTKPASTWFASPYVPKAGTLRKTYKVTFTVSTVTAGNVIELYRRTAADDGNEPVGSFTVTAGGTYSGYVTIVRESSSVLEACWLDGFAFGGTVTGIEWREIPGIHASQATTAAKPILRLNSGIYSAQFDGVDDFLSLGAVPFQMADDHCVVAGAKCSSSASYPFICALSNNSVTGAGAADLYVDASGFVAARWKNDAGTTVFQSAGAGVYANNLPFVASARKVGTAVASRFNGSSSVGGIAPTGATTVNRSVIGTGDAPFPGHIYPVIAIKGTVSDADLLTLEKFVGSLSGVTV